MLQYQIEDNLKREKILLQKQITRKSKAKQILNTQIEEDYQRSRELTRLARQNYIPNEEEKTPLVKHQKRYTIYRKVTLMRDSGLPHFQNIPKSKSIGEDIFEVDDLINDYILSPIFTFESGMFCYVPYKIFDNVEGKFVKKIEINTKDNCIDIILEGEVN